MDEHKEHEQPQHQPHHQPNPPKKTSFTYTHLFYLLGIIAIALTLLNLWEVSTLKTHFTTPSPTAVAKPQIELAIITVNSCTDCFDIASLITKIESLGVEIKDKTNLDYSSSSAQAFVNKYKITRLPAIIIKGEVEKSTQLSTLLSQLGTSQDGNYILPSPMPPYFDPSNGQVRGRISVISLQKSNCVQCSNMTTLLELLKKQMSIKDVKNIDIDSSEGKTLTKKYNISIVPTLIFDQEAVLYPTIAQVWNNVGTIESDGSLVMRNVNPPYYSIPQGKVKGLVSVTYLQDNSCKECYNVSINRLILRQLGLTLDQEKTVDIYSPQAQGLITKYKITKIPTIVLTGDTDTYPSLTKVWKEVGSVESDGTYVLRNIEIFEQPYKDLVQKKVITPVPATAPSAATTPASSSKAAVQTVPTSQNPSPASG